MIDLTVNFKALESSAARARERNIIIPTFAQMKDPSSVPEALKKKLSKTGLWDIKPINLFRITWKNEPKERGGVFGGVNFLELPSALTGVDARIVALIGKWFPTGSHKVGATYGCLAPRLITGQFDPTVHKAVWPSTGNYCRGGAYNASLLACESVAILPEEMSRERFEWLKTVAGEVITTPGGESNIREIFDKCWELKKIRKDIIVFNQFDEFGNYLWHYEVTGSAIEEVFGQIQNNGDRLAGIVLSSGSAGTLSSADYLKEKFPDSKSVAAEALQCPTLLLNGFGYHRIEGIGDKHVPWIHNVRNTDIVIAIDDNFCMNLIRLFNDPVGREYLVKQGIPESIVNNLDLMGISGISNLIASIKFAKYYELTGKDIVFTVFTDSMELYDSRLRELEGKFGKYSEHDAVKDYHRYLMGISIDNMQELTYYDKKRIHNLKYFTWIEQQGRDVKELDSQWYDYPDYWKRIQAQTPDIDRLIMEFNERTGLIK